MIAPPLNSQHRIPPAMRIHGFSQARKCRSSESRTNTFKVLLGEQDAERYGSRINHVISRLGRFPVPWTAGSDPTTNVSALQQVCPRCATSRSALHSSDGPAPYFHGIARHPSTNTNPARWVDEAPVPAEGAAVAREASGSCCPTVDRTHEGCQFSEGPR